MVNKGRWRVRNTEDEGVTEKELNQLHYINTEIKQLKYEIADLENKSIVKAQVITGMPFGSGVGDPTGVKGTELSERKILLNLALSKAEIEKNRIERFISSIDDTEIRIIIRLRHINSLTWEEIGDEVHLSRTGVYKKYKRFLKQEHNSHS